MSFKEYVEDYAKRHPVYWAGGVPWRKYKGVLRPLCHPHLEPKVTREDIRRLLRESKSPLAMWTYEFDSRKSEWWWIVAEKPYRLPNLNSKARYNIRNGLKNCRAEMISGKTLAEIGYDCYRSAMQRHKQTVALSESEFKRRMPSLDGDKSQEIWGVFVGNRLAGFATYLVIDDVVNQLDAIFDPVHFIKHSSYALLHTITDHYLNTRNNSYITTGMRSISHETQFEEFITKYFGYRKAYCKLGLAYAPSTRLLSWLVRRTNPVWKPLSLPSRLRNGLEVMHKLNSIESEQRRANES